MTNQQDNNRDTSILGLSTSELAGLTVDELIGNKTAVNMIMHYYKKLVDDNLVLKNENNTYKTYVDAYQRKKLYSNIATILLTLSNVLVAFGVNLLTMGNNGWPGGVVLGGGIISAGIGIYFSIKS